MFIRFDVIHERDGQTDRQTDGQTLHDSKDRACIASRGKNVRPRVMYMPCKEEQIRLTGAPSYGRDGCVLVISNIVRHNYKLNHNALIHTKLIDILSV